MGLGNFHIGIMGNLFSGKTTLMNALAADPYRSELQALLGGAETHAFTERVEHGSLTDECLALFYQDRVANIFPTETAFLHMRVLQQREIRHLMTRAAKQPVLVLGPEHAQTMHRDGLRPASIQEALYERSKVHVSRISKESAK